MHEPHDKTRTLTVSRRRIALWLVALGALWLTTGCKGESKPSGEQSQGESTTTPPETEGQSDETDVVAGETPEPGAQPAADADATDDGTPKTFAQPTPRQEELLNGAMAKLDEGDFDAAAMFTLVLTGDDQPASMQKLVGLIVLAEIYKAEDKPEKAIERLSGSIDEFPPNVELPATLAELHLLGDQYAEAIGHLETALAVDGDRVDLLAALARAQQLQGDEAGVSRTVERYGTALARVEAELAAPTTGLERRLELMQALAGVRDARAAALIVKQIERDELEIVGPAFELIVQGGHTEAVPALAELRERETRPEISAALDQALEMLRELEGQQDALPQLPTMPPQPTAP